MNEKKSIFKKWNNLMIFTVIVITIVGIISGYIAYDSYQRSPEYDPVTFDLTIKNESGTESQSAENQSNNIFYIPSIYWTSFPSGYKNSDTGYLKFEFDWDNKLEQDFLKMKNSVFVWLSSQKNTSGGRYYVFHNAIKKMTPIDVKNNIKNYGSNVRGTNDPYIVYMFVGYDNQEVIITNHINEEGYLRAMTIYRPINGDVTAGIIITKVLQTEWFNLDKQLTEYIKSLQTPPSSFKKLK